MGLTPELDPPTAREFAEQIVPGVAAYGQYESGHYVAAAGLATLDVATLGKGKAVTTIVGGLTRTIGRIANRLNVINPRHFQAALREARGEVVARRADGKAFDHIGELREAAAGLKRDVLRIKDEISSGKLGDAAKEAAEAALGRGSKLLDRVENLLKKVDNIKATCPTGTRTC